MKFIITLMFMLVSINVLADVSVRGYTRKDGTYVTSHMRSDPNGTKLDNWSTKGNVNPYTGKIGTKNVDGDTPIVVDGIDTSSPAFQKTIFFNIIPDQLRTTRNYKMTKEAEFYPMTYGGLINGIKSKCLGAVICGADTISDLVYRRIGACALTIQEANELISHILPDAPVQDTYCEAITQSPPTKIQVNTTTIKPSCNITELDLGLTYKQVECIMGKPRGKELTSYGVTYDYGYTELLFYHGKLVKY